MSAGQGLRSGLPPRVLAIAGSDSGGGAGIQADLKAFARSGVHGMTAITAITAQNTRAVNAVYPLPPEAILEQVRTVVEDIGVDAVKIGMLGNVETIAAVERALDLMPGVPMVLDPVIVAESGARLLDEAAEQALRSALVPRVTVVTPNISEAAVLAGRAPETGVAGRAAEAGVAGRAAEAGVAGRAAEPGVAGRAPEAGVAGRAPDDAPNAGPEPELLARAVHALGPRAVVVTGGHREEATDLFFDGERAVEIPGVRYPDGASHGSGCTHSSTLAAQLALGAEPLQAARRAKQIASEAVRDGLRGLGSGAGPVDVFGLARR
jgi:hydroxymethylpyrimidine/phosphomethylpyrimidine kinase